MNLRRRPKSERIVHELKGIDPKLIVSDYAEEIVRLRGAMTQAVRCLEDPNRGPAEARTLLIDTLDREGWWR